jgi:hypothetical protein
MDASRFDDVVRSLTNAPSRRGVLAAFAAAALGLAAPVVGDAGKGKKRKKKVKRNEFGCVNVGGKCRGKDALCCSGICQGKKRKKGNKDKSRCVAHDAGNCQPGQNKCAGPEIGCSRGDDGKATFCFTTTGTGEYCSSGSISNNGCTKDAECEADCGIGAACVRCEGAPFPELTGRCVGLDRECGIGG